MRLWRVSDPQLKGCAFCGLYETKKEAHYHASAWHRGKVSTNHPAWRFATRIF